tara:strand:- start:2461 stop:2805 length:345 start_codon:yes stop_codon:yes gene_type:complete
MNCEDVLAARFLATLQHEMSISAGAGPFPFDAFGVSTRANDGVSTAVSRWIFNSPNVSASAVNAAVHCTTRTLANFPCVELLATHESRTFASPNENSVGQNVKNSHAESISSTA